RRRQCIETLLDQLLEVDGGSAGYDRRVARVQVLAGRDDTIQKFLCAAAGRVDDRGQLALYLRLGRIGGGSKDEVRVDNLETLADRRLRPPNQAGPVGRKGSQPV